VELSAETSLGRAYNAPHAQISYLYLETGGMEEKKGMVGKENSLITGHMTTPINRKAKLLPRSD